MSNDKTLRLNRISFEVETDWTYKLVWIMTVIYTSDVATSSGKGKFLQPGNFFKLLFRWRGSIYKVVLLDCIVYGLLYAVISCVYRFLLKPCKDQSYKVHFEMLVKYCGDYAGLIPVSFVLGFYVAQIVTRWWNQFTTIPWPDVLAGTVVCSLHGEDERSRMMRRTIIRYINCTFVLTLVNMSPQVKTRFPTMDHIVEAGLLMPHERIIFDHLNENTDYPKYWIPIIWALNIASRARLENRIVHEISFTNIINLILRFRNGCGDLLGYDWVCIPLVYTQVVTLAVHLYFFAALFGKQFIDDEHVHEIDLYVPVFLFLEFFFYMGWLKVAETMVNPFGEDDDDFEVNWLIDRHFSLSYLIVEMGGDFPHLSKDMYWDVGVPDGLPYTKAAEKFRTGTHQGSAHLQDVDLGDYMEPRSDKEKDQDQEAGRQSLFSSSRGAGTRRSRTETRVPPAHYVGSGDEIGIDLDPAAIQANIDQDKKPLAHLMEPMAIDRHYRPNPSKDAKEKAKGDKDQEHVVGTNSSPQIQTRIVTGTNSSSQTQTQIQSTSTAEQAANQARKFQIKKP